MFAKPAVRAAVLPLNPVVLPMVVSVALLMPVP